MGTWTARTKLLHDIYFPDVSRIRPYNVGRNPPLYCTLMLIAMQGQQNRWKPKRPGAQLCCHSSTYVHILSVQYIVYIGMVITYSRIWINRVRLPIPLVVSPRSCLRIWSRRDGFGRPVPRQPAHSPHSGWIGCILTGFLPISAVAPIYLYRHPPSGVNPDKGKTLLTIG